MRYVLLTAIASAGAAVLAGCGDDASREAGGNQETKPAPVRVAEAKMRQFTPTVPIVGTVVSRQDANVAAEVAGRLDTVAEVGTELARGDTVAAIDDTQLRLQVREQKATVQREQARLDYLEREVERLRSLAARNALAENQLDQRISEKQVADSELEVARSRLAQLEDQLSRTRIAAPFTGVVTDRLAMPGERVEPGDPVVRLVSAEEREVVARGPLEYLPYVSPGDPIQVRRRDESLVGRVRSVVRAGDELSHLFEVRIDVPDSQWPVGQTVQVLLPTADTRNALAVPRDALVLRRDGTSVYVVDGDNIARQVIVQPGSADGPYVEIRGSVEPGDRVIIRGNERIQPDQPVKVLEG